MTEPQPPSRRRRGPTKKDKAEGVTDPLTGGEPAAGGSDVPVELEEVAEHQLARQEASPEEPGVLSEDLDLYDDDHPAGWDTDYDEDAELEPDYDEESEFEADYDEESDFGPDFGRGEGPGHGPAPRLAPGPKHGPGHPPPPPHEHGPGPKKTPAKKAPGKKTTGPKKHPGHHPGPPHEHHPQPPHDHGPGPKKHPGRHPGPPPEHDPGHPPPPPHEHGPEYGPGGLGPEPGFGFGPGAGFGYGPGPGFGFDFGPASGRGRRRGARPGRRGRPGDVRAAILILLAERPMHGYEMIQEITERSQDLWRLSPGSVYPTLQLLDDEGLIIATETEGSKKLFELTDQGRAAAEKIKTPPWQKITEGADTGQVDLRTALAQLVGAVTQSAYAFTAEYQQRVVAILKKARREIYTLLAEAE